MKPNRIVITSSGQPYGRLSTLEGGGQFHAVVTNGFECRGRWESRKQVRLLDGQIEQGREIFASEDGALRICLIGSDFFTRDQIVSVVKLIKWWQREFKIPTEKIDVKCEPLTAELVQGLVKAKTESMNLLDELSTAGR